MSFVILNKIHNMYKILGLSKNATFEQIRKKYKKLALLYHPDKNPQSTVDFSQIQEAYSVLSDPMRRRVYDMMQCDTKESFDHFFTLFMKWACIALTYKKLFHQVRNHPCVYKKKPNIEICQQVTLDDIYAGRAISIPFERDVFTNDELKSVRETISLSLVGYKKEYVFPDMGHAYKKSDIITENGQPRIDDTILYSLLIITLDIVPRSDITITDIISPYDIEIHVPIDFVDYINGKHVSCNVFGRRIDTVYTGGEPCITTCENQGLPMYENDSGDFKRGDMYVILDLKLPNSRQISALRGQENTEWGMMWKKIKDCLDKTAGEEHHQSPKASL